MLKRFEVFLNIWAGVLWWGPRGGDKNERPTTEVPLVFIDFFPKRGCISRFGAHRINTPRTRKVFCYAMSAKGKERAAEAEVHAAPSADSRRRELLL